MSVHDQRSPQPGVVVATLAEVGQVVRCGDPLLVIEAMKCEHRIVADVVGRLDWLVEPGAVLRADDRVARIVERSTPRPPAPGDVVQIFMSQGVPGSFEPLRLDEHGERLIPAGDRGRAHEEDAAGVVVGMIAHRLDGHDEPVRRVWICGNATRSLGAVAEPECRRIVAAIDLAEREQVPLEWVAVSSGARISMESGTENMDWCAAVVRRLVEFTQADGEVLVVVAGVNVGAQSYWNAEATMLLHCAGTLVMVDGTSMVLTGSRWLGRAGGVTEASDHDLGGTEVMSANGQAHHVVADLSEAVRLLLEHHALCASGPRHPRRPARTGDDPHRDVGLDRYPGPVEHGWSTVGELLAVESNPGRSRPFSVRAVMGSLVDRDAPLLERWSAMAGAEGAVVWDSRIDGWAATVVGIESHPRGTGGEWQAAGTLYPMAARKVARALNRASGRRPAVVVANLAGFDGSRRSLAEGQLEHGGELARAVVNFRGPLVVLVVGRFHGGAYVVLNRRLNPELRIVAVEGTRVSVIGGTSAADVVLRREVDDEMHRRGHDRAAAVRAVASRFDEPHDVERALSVGSVDLVVAPGEVRSAVAGLLADPSLSPTRRAPRPAGTSAARA